MVSTLKNRWILLLSGLHAIWSKVDTFAVNHETALFWIFGILYKFALDALYVWCASPMFSYAGLIYAPSFFKYFVATGMYLLLFTYLPKAEKSAVIFLFHLQFVFTVAPMLTFYSFSGGSSKYMLMVFLCILLETYMLRRPASMQKPVHITGVQNYVTVALGILIVFTLIVPILYNGFEGLKAFDFAYIYEMRANASYPAGFGYLLNWITKAIIPFSFVCLLHQKKYSLAFIVVFFQIFFYMETGEKITLFILVPICAVYFLSKSGHLLKLMYAGLAILFLGVTLAYQLDIPTYQEGAPFLSRLGVMLGSLIAVRTVFHPADNKFNFYECFSQYPKIHFSDGQIGKMIGLTYPYGGSSGQVVYSFSTGEKFMEGNFNTGYLGESYAQLGFLGMLLMSALLASILCGLRPYDSKENFSLLAALFSVYVVVLNDGALLTALFTSGMFITFILVFIYFSKTGGARHGIQRL